MARNSEGYTIQIPESNNPIPSNDKWTKEVFNRLRIGRSNTKRNNI